MLPLKLTYLTGNEDKFREAQMLLPGVERMELDLPEIQSLDSREIIEAKLAVANRLVPDGNERVLLVEDASLTFDTMGGLPGPLVKWFWKELGTFGLYKMAQAFGVKRGFVTLTVGMALPEGKHLFFGAKLEGGIVTPKVLPEKGDKYFGFDPIFAPDGMGGKTFGEMTREEKNSISHRALALKQVREYLELNLKWPFPKI